MNSRQRRKLEAEEHQRKREEQEEAYRQQALAPRKSSRKEAIIAQTLMAMADTFELTSTRKPRK